MKYKFSPSKFYLLKDCQKCFWLEHNRNLKRPEGIFPSLPSGMDIALKEHFDNYLSRDELPPEIAHLEGVKLFSDISKLSAWRHNQLGIMLEEEKFILKGAIDNMLIRGNKLIILDYKTRGFPLRDDTHEHYIEQLSMYNYIFRKNGYDTEDYSYLLFYYPRKVVENVFLFNRKLIKINTEIKIAEELIAKSISLLEKDIPKPSKNCDYCRYREHKTLSDF